MREFMIRRHSSILDILIDCHVVSSKSEGRVFVQTHPIFIDNERINHSDWTIDFIQKHRKDRLFDRHKKSAILKRFSIMRIGGSENPLDDRHGEKFMLKRIGANPDKVEVFK